MCRISFGRFEHSTRGVQHLILLDGSASIDHLNPNFGVEVYFLSQSKLEASSDARVLDLGSWNLFKLSGVGLELLSETEPDGYFRDVGKKIQGFAQGFCKVVYLGV